MRPQALCYSIHKGGERRGLDAHYVQVNSKSVFDCGFSFLLIHVFALTNYRFFTTFLFHSFSKGLTFYKLRSIFSIFIKLILEFYKTHN